MKWRKCELHLPAINQEVFIRRTDIDFHGYGYIPNDIAMFACGNASFREFHKLEWLDETTEPEPLYTEKDLADFAKYCGEQFQYIDGYWRDDPDPRKWTTEELLKLYLSTRIPSLP